MKIVLRKSDRLFLALIAVALGYLVIFMMLQMSALEEQENIIPFNDATADVQIKDELELTKDNIEILDNSSNQNLTNSARDLNDTRKKSMDDWSENKPSSYQNSDPVQAAKDFEKQLFAEAGGAKERERIDVYNNNIGYWGALHWFLNSESSPISKVNNALQYLLPSPISMH